MSDKKDTLCSLINMGHCYECEVCMYDEEIMKEVIWGNNIYTHETKEDSKKFISGRVSPKIKDITIGGKKIDVKPLSFRGIKGSSK